MKNKKEMQKILIAKRFVYLHKEDQVHGWTTYLDYGTNNNDRYLSVYDNLKKGLYGEFINKDTIIVDDFHGYIGYSAYDECKFQFKIID